MNILSFIRRSILAVSVLGLAAAAPAMAQRGTADRADRGAFLERHVERLDRKLDLSEAQEAEIRSILAQHMGKAAAHRGERRADRRAERGEQMRSHRAAVDEAILGVLTPEQREIYQRERAERPERAPRPRDRHQRMVDALDLTPEQQEQLERVHEEHRAAFQSWAASNPDASREDRQAFIKEHHSQVQSTLEGILTPEQMEKFRDTKAKRGERGERGRQRGGNRDGGHEGHH